MHPGSTSLGRSVVVALAAMGVACGCDCGRFHPPIPSQADSSSLLSKTSVGTSPKAPGFLKGQLHAHSNGSGDSDTPPDQVARWYALHHYDFIVFTDHNRVTDTPDPEGMLTLPGVELTQNLRLCSPLPEPGFYCLLHVNALLVTSPALPDGWQSQSLERQDIYAAAVGAALQMGGIAQLNHPNFHHGANLDIVLSLATQGLVLIEIANQALDSQNQGDDTHLSTEALWDAALSRGAHVFATATDDAHHYNDAQSVLSRGEIAYQGDRGFVMVRATKDMASIRNALLHGDFYASTGVLLQGLDLTPDHIVIDVSSTDEPTTIEFIGTGGKRLEVVRGNHAKFNVASHTTDYVRIRVTQVTTTGDHKHAWTQPVWKTGNTQ